MVCLSARRQIQSARSRIKITGALIARTRERLVQSAAVDDHVRVRYHQLLEDATEARSRFERRHTLLMEGTTASVWISRELLDLCDASIEESRQRIDRCMAPVLRRSVA